MQMIVKAGLASLLLGTAGCSAEDAASENAPTASAAQQFEDIPGDLPVYPGVERVQRMNGSPSENRPNGSRIVNYNLEDDPRIVIDFYAAAVEKAGYTVRQRSDYAKSSEIKIDGATEGLHVTARKGADGRTHVQIIDYTPR